MEPYCSNVHAQMVLRHHIIQLVLFCIFNLTIGYAWIFLVFKRKAAETMLSAWDKRRHVHVDKPLLPPTVSTNTLELALCPSVRKQRRFAITSLLLDTGNYVEDARYHEAAVKLGHSISTYSPRVLDVADMILMLTPGMADFNKFAMHRAGWQMCMIEAIESPRTRHKNRFLEAGMFSRLNAWKLNEYEAVLSLDLDTLVVADITSIFSYEYSQMVAKGFDLAAASDTLPVNLLPFCKVRDTFNAGVLLLVPSSHTFARLLHALKAGNFDMQSAEQGLLNALYPRGQYWTLPFRFNARIAKAGCAAEEWRSDLHSAVIIHYVVVKGWGKRDWSSLLLGSIAGVVDMFYVWELMQHRKSVSEHVPTMAAALSSSSSNCKHVESRDTTVVTGLWNIDRENSGDGRSFRVYLQWFKKTLELDAAMVVFASRKTLSQVRRKRDAMHIPTCYVPFDVEDMPYYTLFGSKLQKILHSATYRWKTHHPFRVEAINAKYNIVQWNKVYLLDLVQRKYNFFESTSFVWADAGISRFMPAKLPGRFPHTGIVSKLLRLHPTSTMFVSGGFFFFSDQKLAATRCHADMIWRGDNIFQGTLMLVNGSTITAFEKTWRAMLSDLISMQQANNDQVVMAMMWCRQPTWFSIVDVPGATTGKNFLRFDDFLWGLEHGTVSRYDARPVLVRSDQNSSVI